MATIESENVIIRTSIHLFVFVIVEIFQIKQFNSVNTLSEEHCKHFSTDINRFYCIKKILLSIHRKQHVFLMAFYVKI